MSFDRVQKGWQSMVCGEPNILYIYTRLRLYSTTILRNSITVLLWRYVHGYKKPRYSDFPFFSFQNWRRNRLDDEMVKVTILLLERRIFHSDERSWSKRYVRIKRAVAWKWKKWNEFIGDVPFTGRISLQMDLISLFLRIFPLFVEREEWISNVAWRVVRHLFERNLSRLEKKKCIEINGDRIKKDKPGRAFNWNERWKKEVSIL